MYKCDLSIFSTDFQKGGGYQSDYIFMYVTSEIFTSELFFNRMVVLIMWSQLNLTEIYHLRFELKRQLFFRVTTLYYLSM